MKAQKIINLILKITILLLITHALIYPDLAQYHEKGMKYRIIAYPLGAFSVFIFNYISKTKNQSYPYKNDILLSTIIAFDMLSNSLGFYGSIEWWDDMMHLINSYIVALILMNVLRHRFSTPAVTLLTIGFISWLQIAWEVAEYITFVTTSSKEMPLAYRDTIGDFVFGQLGLIAALIYANKFSASRKYPSKMMK